MSGLSTRAASIEQAHTLTDHARSRMESRGISEEIIEQVLTYGRSCKERGAEIFVIGRREVSHYARLGIDLRQCEGVHVVCSTEGAVLTTYRNHDLRGLRPQRRRGTRRR